MSDNRYIVTRSNYTIKASHKQLSSDTIYERDYMTTSNWGGYDSGAIPLGEGNFKFIYSDDSNEKRKHKYGEWLKPTNCGEEDNEYWNLDCTGSGNPSSSESRIIRKPNYTSFKDFVYYGNCVKLIKSGVEEVISKYPGELYVSEVPFTYNNFTGGTSYLGSENMGVVENPFLIDIVSPTKLEGGIDYRYFCESWYNYQIIDGSGNTYEIENWETNIRKKTCFNDGNIVANIVITYNSGQTLEIVQYYYGNEKILLSNKSNSGCHIRLNNNTVSSIFDGLDSFSTFLLNRDSNPLYTITIEHPYDTGIGTVYIDEHLSWPTENGWNLDISSKAYSVYIKTLIDIAEWYDENRTDNIWRCMTHESIKNMDKTFVNTKTDEDYDDYKIGTSNIQALLQIYGKFFDNIKFDIDNIKYINNITYNNKNNAPDYFLTDKLNMSGWEICSIVPNFDKNLRTEALFIGNSKKYSPSDTNVIFLKNLLINSKALISRKGTREGIEMMLSLFGLKSYDWAKKYYESLPENKKYKVGNRILQWDKLPDSTKSAMYDYTMSEEVAVAYNTSSDIVPFTAKTCAESINEYKSDYYSEANTGDLYGLPARIVAVTTEDGNTYKYLIPWFDKRDSIDGNPYFQMYGGWGKLTEKTITPDKTLYPNINKIKTSIDYTIYSESIKYLKTVNTIGELIKQDYTKLNDGDIFYVIDISNINEYIPSLDKSNASNYFVIEDKNNFKTFDTSNKKFIQCAATNATTVSEFKTNREVLSSFKFSDGEIGDWTYALHDETGEPNQIVVCSSIESSITPYFVENSVGWKNIERSEFTDDTLNYNSLRVVYLNSIIEDGRGNNPHIGYGNYDGGSSYFEIFKQLFKGAIEDDLFGPNAYDCETGKLKSEIYDCGFKIDEHVVDNMKCWYFTDNSKNSNIYTLAKRNVKVIDSDLNTYIIPSGYEVMTVTSLTEDEEGKVHYEAVPFVDKINVGKSSYKQRECNFRSELSAFDFETQGYNSNDESAANSIINSKVLKIYFNQEKYYINDEFHKYFESAILPYLTQLIPSTAIFSAEYSDLVKATFLNSDGSILQESLVERGETPVYSGATPTKEPTQQHYYEFKNWNPTLGPINQDTIFEPVFEEKVQKYTITFKNGDNSNLYGTPKSYDYGQLPTTGATIPTKEQTSEYTYKFSGWNPTISIVTGDCVYRPLFNEEKRKFTISYYNRDARTTKQRGLLQEFDDVEYGTQTPEYTGITADLQPINPLPGHIYTFNGWSPTIEPTVTKNQNYVAKYIDSLKECTLNLYNTEDTEVKELTFDTNGGYPNIEPNVNVGSFNFGKQVSPSSWETMEFTGWNNGKVRLDPLTSSTTITGKTQAVAAFAPLYKITYDANGGLFNDNKILKYDYFNTNENTVAITPSPSRNGYAFKYWTLDRSVDSSEIPYVFGNKLTSNITLYALWAKNNE